MNEVIAGHASKRNNKSLSLKGGQADDLILLNGLCQFVAGIFSVPKYWYILSISKWDMFPNVNASEFTDLVDLAASSYIIIYLNDTKIAIKSRFHKCFHTLSGDAPPPLE